MTRGKTHPHPYKLEYVCTLLKARALLKALRNVGCVIELLDVVVIVAEAEVETLVIYRLVEWRMIKQLDKKTYSYFGFCAN